MNKLLFLLIFLLPSFSYAQNQTQPFLSLENAKQIADACEERAISDNWNVVIAILDGGGHLVYLRKMDGTQIGSVEVAQAKAKSAVYFKRPTKVFEDLVNAGNTRILSLPNAVALEGGIPIFKDGVCIGAIGVSGVTSEQDAIIAEAGLEALEIL
jgi:glc operon protein GlcG